MKRRMLKKKKLGKYKEYSFIVGFYISEDLENDQLTSFCTSFGNFSKKNGLSCYRFSGYMDSMYYLEKSKKRKLKREKLTEEHPKLMEEWLKNNPTVLRYGVSNLKDRWHQSFDEDNDIQWINKNDFDIDKENHRLQNVDITF